MKIMNSAALRVLNEPNGYQVGFDIIKSLVTSQLYRGNGYIWGPRNGRDEVMSMHVLSPDGCQPYKAGGEVFYRTAANPLAEIEVDQFLPARDILHHRMTTLSDPLIGVSPLVAAAATVMGASAIQNHSAHFFRNMARPGGYLTTAGKLDPQKAMEIGKRWTDNYGAAVNAGKTAVLEQGLEYKTAHHDRRGRAAHRADALVGRGHRPRLPDPELHDRRRHEGRLQVGRDAERHLPVERAGRAFPRHRKPAQPVLRADRHRRISAIRPRRAVPHRSRRPRRVLRQGRRRRHHDAGRGARGRLQHQSRRGRRPGLHAATDGPDLHARGDAPAKAGATGPPPPPEEPPPPTAEEVGAALSLEMQRRLSTWSA